ncbi:Endonuclease/exonuclease/phosphatase [Artemisia annua]|uniref:Endonuclease/exonuclease/phosphatase n=1 Tax=Artemisia annua TaxID=35608 RepID=A0A2U1NRV4_ARTAN|nr:Endonuclease/exonuclease/phosphatase [Artemisia annua]
MKNPERIKPKNDPKIMFLCDHRNIKKWWRVANKSVCDPCLQASYTFHLQLMDWSVDSSGEFSVKSARSYIDDTLLPMVGAPTRWVKVVPIKINIFAWKVCLDKLHMRLNLSLRGIDIPSIICPICSSAGESGSHLFFSCNMACLLLGKVGRWWDLDFPKLHSYNHRWAKSACQ